MSILSLISTLNTRPTKKYQEHKCTIKWLSYLETQPFFLIVPPIILFWFQQEVICNSEHDTIIKGCFGCCSVSLWVFSETLNLEYSFFTSTKQTPQIWAAVRTFEEYFNFLLCDLTFILYCLNYKRCPGGYSSLDLQIRYEYLSRFVLGPGVHLPLKAHLISLCMKIKHSEFAIRKITKRISLKTS